MGIPALIIAVAIVVVAAFIWALLAHLGIIKYWPNGHGPYAFGANGAAVLLTVFTAVLLELGGVVTIAVGRDVSGRPLSGPLQAALTMPGLLTVIAALVIWVTPVVPSWMVPRWIREAVPDPGLWSRWNWSAAERKTR